MGFYISKKKRHEVYKVAVKYLQEPQFQKDGLGLCACISWAHLAVFKKHKTFHSFFLYPEIGKHKPKRDWKYWFMRNKEGYEKRTQILKDAIDATK